jgi:hypothetical protein
LPRSFERPKTTAPASGPLSAIGGWLGSSGGGGSGPARGVLLALSVPVVLGALAAPSVADAAENSDERELREKFTALIQRDFHGSFRAAFDHFDKNHDGKIDRGELIEFLKSAGIGNGFTRRYWADGILDKLDTNHDRMISWDEFQPAITASR